MESFNIISDVHGDHDSLMALVNIMPDAPFLSVGDMIDRGRDSLKVLRFFMQKGNKAVLGNHEHMCLDLYFDRRIYHPGIWLHSQNGGYQTLRSFAEDEVDSWAYIQRLENKTITMDRATSFARRHKEMFPKDVMKWLDRLPVFFRRKGLFVSHAPRHPGWKWADLAKSKEEPMRISGAPPNLLWNIGEPGYRKDTVQVNGHITTEEPVFFGEKGSPYSISIDTNRGYGSKLTGLHWPSLEIFQVTIGETTRGT